MNILVLCTGNSARSILLEALLGDLGKGRVTSFSAGSKPAGQVNPGALRCLDRHSITLESPRSKSWNEFGIPDAPQMDIVITVCGNARDEECPIWPGTPLRAHWGVEDPADVTEPVEAVDEAFETAYAILRRRADAFLSEPIESMSADDLKALLARVSDIA